ncbi:flagellar biosynthetic protein FliR [Sulfitobacter sp. R18_1]|uniref:flagellar biosynthetic protein FliR n=1 Tax=Sulfitobacter sp. R18_1 TaxID=2821104 RepID=UPI001ADC9540|nr:flagellar biosynthetic protein FliR [Sulfitobacter sp. R18_1]MBO9428613.1 flagellar biosynthetic protein FliR [Sulfitobacter sp. R18_1]
MDLTAFLTGQIFGYILVIARLGSAMLFMPGLGEAYAPVRVRILLALVLSLALYPMVPVPPLVEGNLVFQAKLIIFEVTIGLWIGLMARILMTCLQFAGFQIGQVSALANAFASNSGSFQGSTMVANFLLVSGVALIFITNTHHIMIHSLMKSYNIFPLGEIIPGDLSQQAAKVATYSIYIGMSLAAPFYVLGILNNVALGLANRMMPTLPVFFVASSMLIFSGLLVFYIAAPSILKGFFQVFRVWFETFEI